MRSGASAGKQTPVASPTSNSPYSAKRQAKKAAFDKMAIDRIVKEAAAAEKGVAAEHGRVLALKASYDEKEQFVQEQLEHASSLKTRVVELERLRAALWGKVEGGWLIAMGVKAL